MRTAKEILKNITLTEEMQKEEDYLLKVIDLVKERCVFFDDVIKESNYLFKAPDNYDELAVEKKWNKEAVTHLQSLSSKFSLCIDFSKNNIEQIFKDYLEEYNVGFGKVMPVLRISITGKMQGPSMFSVMELLGLNEVRCRIEKAITRLGNG